MNIRTRILKVSVWVMRHGVIIQAPATGTEAPSPEEELRALVLGVEVPHELAENGLRIAIHEIAATKRMEEAQTGGKIHAVFLNGRYKGGLTPTLVDRDACKQIGSALGTCHAESSSMYTYWIGASAEGSQPKFFGGQVRIAPLNR